MNDGWRREIERAIARSEGIYGEGRRLLLWGAAVTTLCLMDAFLLPVPTWNGLLLFAVAGWVGFGNARHGRTLLEFRRRIDALKFAHELALQLDEICGAISRRDW